MLGYKKHGPEQCQPIGMCHVTQFSVNVGKKRNAHMTPFRHISAQSHHADTDTYRCSLEL